MYYFYAEDAAGDCSVPIATNMETATKLVLEQENIHLYPGGSTESDGGSGTGRRTA